MNLDVNKILNTNANKFDSDFLSYICGVLLSNLKENDPAFNDLSNTEFMKGYINSLRIIKDEKVKHINIDYNKNEGSLVISSSKDLHSPKNCRQLFAGLENVVEIELSNFITNTAKDMSFMFNKCYKLVKLDVSKFITDNVENMYGMFSNCESLDMLNVKGFNTHIVKDMGDMFHNCSSLAEIKGIENFITKNVKNMSGMFHGCKLLNTLNLLGFDFIETDNIGHMFTDCESLTEVKMVLRKNPKSIMCDEIFRNCTNLTIIDETTRNSLIANNGLNMFAGSGLAKDYIEEATLNII